MKLDYEVRLTEDKILVEQGQIVHHPLNGPYKFRSGQDMPSYGHFTFGGHNLDSSPLFSDIRVFYLDFFGEADSTLDREAWADPLRGIVLQRLSSQDHAWYLSCIGNILTRPDAHISIVDELQHIFPGDESLNVAIVNSERPYGHGKGFAPRLFFEAPNQLLPDIVSKYWPAAMPATPIEGYNMASGQIDFLQKWNARPRDDELFCDVIDQVFVAFYTYPSENRHFVFVTNKLTLDDMRSLLDIESLQHKAQELQLT